MSDGILKTQKIQRLGSTVGNNTPLVLDRKIVSLTLLIFWKYDGGHVTDLTTRFLPCDGPGFVSESLQRFGELGLTSFAGH